MKKCPKCVDEQNWRSELDVRIKIREAEKAEKKELFYKKLNVVSKVFGNLSMIIVGILGVLGSVAAIGMSYTYKIGGLDFLLYLAMYCSLLTVVCASYRYVKCFEGD
jgi:hypothetical protein